MKGVGSFHVSAGSDTFGKSPDNSEAIFDTSPSDCVGFLFSVNALHTSIAIQKG